MVYPAPRLSKAVQDPPPRCDYAPRVPDHGRNVHFEIDGPIIVCRSKRHTNQCSQKEDSKFSARSRSNRCNPHARSLFKSDIFVGSENSKFNRIDESRSPPLRRNKEVKEVKEVKQTSLAIGVLRSPHRFFDAHTLYYAILRDSRIFTRLQSIGIIFSLFDTLYSTRTELI